ncbi:hypothetical protein CBR_g53721 [Chara braunii]|uniref:Uncharacterized protein n=1 Tax=Chara braunii TaxID=69332 RepID=A0A388MBA0_CHABU|nr:hypothetical protein CBR_g53721 [Chara braunii]|eukprot:GBG91830.1 hypothetical protein CBR_g53721 [Chara braunii]
MDQQARQAGGNQASTSASAPGPSASGAIVPYQALSNDVRNDQTHGSSGGGYNGGYGGRYGGSGGYGNYRRPWYSQPSDKNDKVDKMRSWMSEEIQERQRLKREKEECKRKEKEDKRKKEAEGKRLAEIKDKEDFKASIGKMVETRMRSVCEEVLGMKTVQGEQPAIVMAAQIRRRADVDSQKALETDALQSKEEEIARLKKAVADLQRLSCQSQVTPQEQELAALRTDNQHLIQDVIALKEQFGELVKVTKPSVNMAGGASAPAKEKGKAICTPTAGDYIKLSDAYRRLSDDKDMAEREVQALKERINRIGSTSGTPTRVKRKRISRKSISPPSNLRIRLSKVASPVKMGERKHEDVKFVKLKNETREESDFNKRVCTELSKLKKKEIEKLCAIENLEYVTVKSSAAAIADVYTDGAFRKVSDNTEKNEDLKSPRIWLVVVERTVMRRTRMVVVRICHRASVN